MDSSVELGRRVSGRAESRLLIDGDLVAALSGNEFDNHSPATGQLLGSVAAAGAGMALVLAMGELSASLLVLPPGVTTISVRIFQLLHYGVDDRVAALALSVFAAMTALAGLTAAAVALRPRRPF